MKNVLVLTILSLVALNVLAQDIVVKKDGSTILAKVLEVNQDNIKYTLIPQHFDLTLFISS